MTYFEQVAVDEDAGAVADDYWNGLSPQEQAAEMAAFDLNPRDCRAEVWWHADLACWALRLTHSPTGIEVTRYGGHSEGPGGSCW